MIASERRRVCRGNVILVRIKLFGLIYEIYLQSFIFCYYNYCSLLFIKLFLVLSLLLNILMMIIIIIRILIRKVVKCERFCRRLLHVKRSGRFVWKFTDHILYSLERFAIKLRLFFKLPFAFHFSFNYLPNFFMR